MSVQLLLLRMLNNLYIKLKIPYALKGCWMKSCLKLRSVVSNCCRMILKMNLPLSHSPILSVSEIQMLVDLDVKNFLESMKDSSEVCSHEGSLRARMNELLTELQTIHLKSFENFLENIWNRLFAIVSARMSNSPSDAR